MSQLATDRIPKGTLFPRAGLEAARGSGPGEAVPERSPGARWPGQATAGDDHLAIRGDDTGARETLVYLDDRQLGLFSSWGDLVRTLEPGGLLQVDPAGCQFLLAYGLVPPPFSLYANVYTLGVGDRLEIDLAHDAARYEVDFPYLQERSREDVAFDPTTLKRLLAAAVARSVPGDAPAVFMQSSGKDSVGLLLGLAESGRKDLRSVTYDAGYLEQEGPVAAELARRFGIAHRIVEADPRQEYHAFIRFAERAPAVCADLALLAYVHSLRCAGLEGGVVIDGLGNDVYMGYVEPRQDALLSRLSLVRRVPALWGRWEAPALGARSAYLAKSMLMYPAERCLAGSRLAPRAVRELIPGETPFARFFAELDREHRDLGPVDFRAYVRGRFYDGASTMPKGRLAAGHFGARAVFPYCDPELIDYCFNLPLAERYDPQRRVNKLALRRLLRQEIGESPYLQRKGSFRFDVLRFVEQNERAMRAEFDEARSLLRNLDRWTGFYFRRRSNYVHAYALTTLFMLSAWLVRQPDRVTRALAAGERLTPAARVDLHP